MASNPILKLTMRQGPRPDQSFELFKDVHTIGREAGNDIIINDAQVSRHHARLTLQGNAYILEDLGSTNGSFVNGRRVTGPVALSAGDMVGLGDNVVLAVSGAADIAATQVGRAMPATAPTMQAATPPPRAQAAAAPKSVAPAPPSPPPAAGSANTQRMLVIGCAGLALLAVICVMGLVAWSFLDCQSFAVFWKSLPILGGIPISC